MLTGQPISQISSEIGPELILELQKWVEVAEEKEEKEPTELMRVDLTPRAIMSMINQKIAGDLFRFRTCCTDAQASR